MGGTALLPRSRPVALTALVALVVGLLMATVPPAHASFPDTPYPQVNLDKTIRTSPFPGTTTTMRDNEGSAYVARDQSLWLADDDGRQILEIDPFSGQLKRTIGEQQLSAALPYGGGKQQAGTWRVRDLESIAYDVDNDVLYAFSGKCCTTSNLPTVFRFVRGANGQLGLESYRALASTNDFTGAAWNPGDGKLYVGVQSDLRTYDYASNTAGPVFQITHLSRITGLSFSADGADLYVAHAITKVSRIRWATRTMVPGWSFDLASFGIQDARAVEVFADRLWVSDGYDFRPAGDPLSHAVFVFSLTQPPPNYNIIGNPGFEQDLTGWNNNKAAGTDLARVGSAHSGDWGARLTNGNNAPTTLTLNDSPNWVEQTVAGTYTARVWVRSDNLTGPVILRVREYDDNDVKVGEVAAQVDVSQAWQQITLSIVPNSPGTSSLDVNVYAYKAPAGATLDIDDVVLNFA